MRADSSPGFVVLNYGFSTTQGRPIVTIQDLYVRPTFRRAGIAGLLIRKCIETAERMKANRVQLQTGSHNSPARRLYDKFGFEPIPDKETYMYFLRE